MAEFGDALSTALTSQSEGLPSVFEALAQDNLSTSIRPAIKHVVKVLAQNAPHRFGWSFAWFDEIYTLAHAAIEHHFLSNHLASFAEYYYDLQRKPVSSASTTHQFPLGRQEHSLSIAMLTIFPYIQLKLEELYKVTKEKYDLGGEGAITQKQKAFLWCYPFLHMLWNATVLYYNFMFAIGKSDYHSPLYRAVNIKLILADPFTFKKEESGFARSLTNLLSGGIHIGVFALQFIEWWYDENNENSIKEVLKQPVPEPPIQALSKTKLPVPQSGVCPLCNRFRRNDTALMTSGYVFCYVCIYKYVKANKQCPVSGYSADTSKLIKLYPPT